MKSRFGCGGEDGDDGLVMTMMMMDGDVVGKDGKHNVAGDGEDHNEGENGGMRVTLLLSWVKMVSEFRVGVLDDGG